MNRLLLPIAALLVSGLLAASASAMPLDANPARSAAMQRAYASPLGTDVAAPDQQAPTNGPAVSSSPAVSSDSGSSGPDWTISIVAGLALIVVAAGAGTMFGRAHARPGHRLA
jgi:hypothetical protein